MSPADSSPSAPTDRRFGGAWTGGQWSVARIVFGTFVAIRLGTLARPLVPLVSPAHGLIAVGLVAAIAFVVGAWTRVAAAVLLLVGSGLAVLVPWATPARLLVVALPLVANLLVPPAPFGSFAARGRVDPDGGWRLPSPVFALLWLGVAASCAWSSFTKLCEPTWRSGHALSAKLWNPGSVRDPVRDLLSYAPPWLLQVLTFAALGAGFAFVALAAFRATRPIAWGVLLVCHFAALPIAGLRDEHLGVIAVLFFLFDPAWLPPRVGRARDFIFFDGGCGLCHRLVRFVLGEDRAGIFEFSPLQGSTVRAVLDEKARANLPDSVIVRDAKGHVLAKSTAVIHIYDRLGGMWRVLAMFLSWIPRPLRDLGYDIVARVRHLLFARPADSCPITPPALKDRFVA